jgi:hypothetical protein
MDPEDRVRYLKHEEGVLENEGSAPLLNLRLVRLDGAALDVELKAIPFNHEMERGTHIILRETTGREGMPAE